MTTLMQPIHRPAFAPLPRDPDIVVVGAGAAGIAAARHCRAEGVSVAVMEAQDRIGGRAVTVQMRGHAIDLGAHWLHEGEINPLVRLAKKRGEPLRPAPQQRHLFVRGRAASPAEQQAEGSAFERAEQAFIRASKAPQDSSLAGALPILGRQRASVVQTHTLLSGRPLAEASAFDFPTMSYGDNFFMRGGYGAYLARLADGLPIQTGAAIRHIDWSGEGVTVEGEAGSLSARAVIVTVPVAVLQAGGIRFTPALPEPLERAISGFLRGTYEHVVLNWPSAPFHGADRLAKLIGTTLGPLGLMTRLDGSPYHYLELDHVTAETLRRDRRASMAFAREVLRQHFGGEAIRDLTPLAVTDWYRDAHALAAWAGVPPGAASARDEAKAPVGDRIWLAGEALSRAQWGMVGGAWEEGARAAAEAVASLR